MILGRFVFITALCVGCILWAAWAVYPQILRLRHYALLAELRQYDAASDPAMLEEAIQDYKRAIDFVDCNMVLHKDLSLLTARAADIAIRQSSEASDLPLQKAVTALKSQLSCSPADGKTWLDYAWLNNYREGFTERSLRAYKMSGYVSPGESWLAEKRLQFALQFLPLLDEEALALARRDFATLERAHPNRMLAVLKVAQVNTTDELYALFSAQ